MKVEIDGKLCQVKDIETFVINRSPGIAYRHASGLLAGPAWLTTSAAAGCLPQSIARPAKANAETHTAKDRDPPRGGGNQTSYPETQQNVPEHPPQPAHRTSEAVSQS